MLSQKQALLNAILANQEDDRPRLDFSDYLEESGEPERAEFIRVQCELAGIDRTCPGPDLCRWKPCRYCALRKRERELFNANLCRWEFGKVVPNVAYRLPFGDISGLPADAVILIYSRGFVSEVRAPLAVLVGGDCKRCEGRGRLGHPAPGQHGYIGFPPCPDCGVHTGYTPGIAREIAHTQPVTAWVATDKEPDTIDGDCRCWLAESPRIPNGASVLPSSVFGSLEGGRTESGDIFDADHFVVEEFWRIYESKADALAALSAAIATIAKQKQPAESAG